MPKLLLPQVLRDKHQDRGEPLRSTVGDCGSGHPNVRFDVTGDSTFGALPMCRSALRRRWRRWSFWRGVLCVMDAQIAVSGSGLSFWGPPYPAARERVGGGCDSGISADLQVRGAALRLEVWMATPGESENRLDLVDVGVGRSAAARGAASHSPQVIAPGWSCSRGRASLGRLGRRAVGRIGCRRRRHACRCHRECDAG